MLKTLAYYGLFLGVSLGVHIAVIFPWKKRTTEEKPASAVAVARIVQEALAIQAQLNEAAQAAELAAAEIDKAERQMPPEPEPQPQPQPQPIPPELAPAAQPDERYENLLAASDAQQRQLEELKRQQQEVAERREQERVEEKRRFEELVERLEEQDRKQRQLEEENRRLEAEARQLADARAKAEAERAKAEQVAAVTRAEAEAARRRVAEDAAAERARADAEQRRREDALARERAEALARADAERRRREEAERELAERSASVEARERELAQRLATLDDWKRYRDAAASAPIDVKRVPAISLTEPLERPQDFLELLRFYQMEVVVYPPAKADLLAHVDLATGTITEIRDAKAFLGRFATWNLRNVGREWEPLVRRVADKFRRDPATLGCYVVFPHETAGYFAWKQIEAVKASGLDPRTVRRCWGRYRRDPSGRWLVEIEMIETLDGQQHQVR